MRVFTKKTSSKLFKVEKRGFGSLTPKKEANKTFPLQQMRANSFCDYKKVLFQRSQVRMFFGKKNEEKGAKKVELATHTSKKEEGTLLFMSTWSKWLTFSILT